MKRETRELNRKTGELIRNANVNKMSYLAPAGTCTGAQAGRCAIGECDLADAAPLLAVPSDIRSCGRACSCHMHCHGGMATCERKLRSSGVPPRAGSVAGAGGRAPAAQIVGGARAQGREAGRARWQHTAARTAHPRQRPRAWPAAHRKQVLRHEDGNLFMFYGPHTQKIPFKHHAPHTWYAPAH